MLNSVKKSWLLIGSILLLLLCFFVFKPEWGSTVGQYTGNIFESIEYTLLDKRFEKRSQKLTPSKDIVVVALDRKMMTDAKNYPELGISGLTLSRKNLAEVVEYIGAQKPKAVILDIELMGKDPYDALLSESFKKSGRVYSAFRMDNTLSSFLRNKKVPREHLQAVLKASGMPDEKSFQTHFCLNGFYKQSYKNVPEFLEKLDSIALPVSNPKGFSPNYLHNISYCSAGQTSSSLINNLTAFGVSSVRYDSDALVRKVIPLYRSYKTKLYGNLALKPALDALSINDIQYNEGNLDLYANKKLIKSLVMDQEGKVFLNWRDPVNSVQWLKDFGASEEQINAVTREFRHGKANAYLGGGVLYRYVSASDILRMRNDINLDNDPPYTLFKLPYSNAKSQGYYNFKDKYVVIGNTVTDVHQTPMGEITPGPEIIATALDMYLHDYEFVKTLPTEWVLFITISIAFLLALLIIRHKSVLGAILYCLLLIVVYFWANFKVFYDSAIWVPIAIPVGIFLLSILLAIFYRHQVHDREKRYLTTVFSKYISPQVMDKVIENPETALDKLKGDKRYMTALFSDLIGFTTYMDNAEPEKIMNQLTIYFDAMIEIIYEHGGTYDKFMGDGILVFFGAPVEMDDHALQACKAAIAMQEKLQTLNKEFEAMGLKKLEQGIGISTGDMIVGNFGSSNIKNFTVMGSAVNLGARLEAYTRQIDDNILISEETQNNIEGQLQTTRHDGLTIKGLPEKISAFSLKSQ